MREFWPALKLYCWMAFLLGVAYPLLITLVSFLGMRELSSGSLVMREGKVIGSKLIAQKFTSNKYFWPRPSAGDYNTIPSSSSNLGPTSAMLQELVEARRKALNDTENEVPSDLLFASGSGLDPHISPQTAYFQVDRISQATGLNSNDIRRLIDSMTQRPFPPFLGPPYVNVLMLNLAIDEQNAIRSP